MNGLPLPQWAYVPGDVYEADADNATLAQVKRLVPSALRGYVPARHPALRYGIALNDRGYFWQAREILETVWAAAPQGGRGAYPLARPHPDRQRKPAPAHGEAGVGHPLVQQGAGRAQQARRAQGASRDGFSTEALGASLKAKLQRPQPTKADWVALAGVVQT